jgi:hypothetical protein
MDMVYICITAFTKIIDLCLEKRPLYSIAIMKYIAHIILMIFGNLILQISAL